MVLDYPQYLNGDVVTDVIDGSFLPDDPLTNFYANNIVEFKNRLFVGYPDGSLVFSAAEDPLNLTRFLVLVSSTWRMTL